MVLTISPAPVTSMTSIDSVLLKKKLFFSSKNAIPLSANVITTFFVSTFSYILINTSLIFSIEQSILNSFFTSFLFGFIKLHPLYF